MDHQSLDQVLAEIEVLRERVLRALDQEPGAMSSPAGPPRPELRDRHEPALLGVDGQIEALRATIERVARTNATVLITGESGTGKDLVARLIHSRSPWVTGPFVPVDCPSVPAPLFENELFGHERGAYTGADRRQRGKLQEGAGGTVFLDEVADLPLEIQPKLLRFLQERQVVPLGSARPVVVTLRVISATNRDLEAMVERGAFRRDLFFRLNVITIALPPLRERRRDIPLLVAHFVRRFCGLHGLPLRTVEPEALALLVAYDWPGNVRELENVVERAVIMAQGSVLTTEALPDAVLEGAGRRVRAGRRGEQEPGAEARIGVALRAENWNISRAARELGVHRSTLYRKMMALGLRPPARRADALAPGQAGESPSPPGS
jgi:DNA-binding NtrC family response regulator